jgi:hypothetical protein
MHVYVLYWSIVRIVQSGYQQWYSDSVLVEVKQQHTTGLTIWCMIYDVRLIWESEFQKCHNHYCCMFLLGYPLQLGYINEPLINNRITVLGYCRNMTNLWLICFVSGTDEDLLCVRSVNLLSILACELFYYRQTLLSSLLTLAKEGGCILQARPRCFWLKCFRG